MIEEIDCITDYKKIRQIAESEISSLRGIILNETIDKFKITKQRDGKYPAIITISGFTSEDKDNQAEWQQSILETYPDREWFHLEWNAEKLPFDEKIVSKSPTIYEEKPKDSNKTKFSKILNKAILAIPLPYVKPLYLLVNNYWSIAVRNSKNAGICLAYVLNSCKKKEFILVGHSLGARIIYNCMKYGIEKNLKMNIVELHLLGGAICGDEETWYSISKNVKNNINNYFSDNDNVLKYLFRIGMFSMAKPIGLRKIDIYNFNYKVINKDVTRYVSGHKAYIENFHKIRKYYFTKF